MIKTPTCLEYTGNSKTSN